MSRPLTTRERELQAARDAAARSLGVPTSPISMNPLAAPSTDNSGGGGLMKVAGQIAGGVGDFIDLTAKYASRPLAGLVAKGSAQLPDDLRKTMWNVNRMMPVTGAVSMLTGFDPFSLNMSAEEEERVRKANSFTNALQEAQTDQGVIAKTGTEMLFDPTTYLTGGVVGGIGKGLGLATKFPKAFLAARGAADVVDRVSALPITAPLRGGKKLGQATIGKLRPEWFEKGKMSVARLEAEGFQGTVRDSFTKGFNIKDLPNMTGSLGRKQAADNRTEVGTLMSAGKVKEAQKLLDNLKPTSLKQLYEDVGSDGTPLGNLVRDTMQKKNFLTPRQVAQTTELVDEAAKVTKPALNAIGKATKALNTKDYTNFAKELDSWTDPTTGKTKWSRVRGLWDEVQKSPGLSPNGEVEAEFAARGWTKTTPASTVYDEGLGWKHALRREQHAERAQNLTLNAQRTINEVIDDRGRQFGGATTQAPIVKKLLQEQADLNPHRFQARMLLDSPELKGYIDSALSAATPEEATQHIGRMYLHMDWYNSAQGVLFPKFREWTDKLLPKSMRNIDTVLSPGLNRRVGPANSVLNDADNELLSNTMSDQRFIDLQEKFTDSLQNITPILEREIAAGRLTALNDNMELITAADLHNLLDNNLVTGADATELNKFLKMWGMDREQVDKLAKQATKMRRGDQARTLENLNIRTAYFDELIDEHWKMLQVKHNLDDRVMKGFAAKMAWIPKAWREQALLSPRYHLSNILDMTIKSAIFGVNPLRPRGSAQDFAKAMGVTPPREVFLGEDDVTLSTLRQQPAPPNPNVPGRTFVSPTSTAGTTGVTDAIGGGAPTTLGNIPGAPGAVADNTVRWNRRLSRAIENSFRLTAWQAGFKDALHASKGMFYKEVQRIIPGPIGADITTTLSRKGSKDINSLGIGYSAEELRRIVLDAGGGLDQANQLADLWTRQMDTASRYGSGMSNKVHFDYDKSYAIEEKLHLQGWMPFHFFATRNLPFYMETLAANPAIMRAWQTYFEFSEEERERLGLPTSYRGFIDLPIPENPLTELLFGPGQIYFNPSVLLSYTDQTRKFEQILDPWNTAEGFEEPEGAFTPLGSLVRRFEGTGLGVGPWFNYPLSMLGAFGTEDEPQNVIRLSDPVQAVANRLGYDGPGSELGQGAIRAGTNFVRERFTDTKRETESGSARFDNKVITRIAEMSVELTGQPQHPAFVAAAKDPESEIYKAALHEVQQQEGRVAMSNFISPVPFKSRNNTAAAIEQARQAAGVPENVDYDDPAQAALMDQLEAQGSLATAGAGYQRPKTIDASTGEYVKAGKRTGGGGGKGNDSYSPETKWGGDVWGPDQPFPYGTETYYKLYMYWRNLQPETADRSPATFVAQYGLGQ